MNAGLDFTLDPDTNLHIVGIRRNDGQVALVLLRRTTVGPGHQAEQQDKQESRKSAAGAATGQRSSIHLLRLAGGSAIGSHQRLCISSTLFLQFNLNYVLDPATLPPPSTKQKKNTNNIPLKLKTQTHIRQDSRRWQSFEVVNFVAVSFWLLASGFWYRDQDLAWLGLPRLGFGVCFKLDIKLSSIFLGFCRPFCSVANF